MKSDRFIKQCSAESVTQISIIEVMDWTPEAIITVTSFRYKTMDVWIPVCRKSLEGEAVALIIHKIVRMYIK